MDAAFSFITYMYIMYAESNLDVRLQYSTLMSNIDFWKVDFFSIEINILGENERP